MAYKHPRAQRRSKRCTGGVPQIGILQHSIFPAAVCIHVSSFQHIKNISKYICKSANNILVDEKLSQDLRWETQKTNDHRSTFFGTFCFRIFQMLWTVCGCSPHPPARHTWPKPPQLWTSNYISSWKKPNPKNWENRFVWSAPWTMITKNTWNLFVSNEKRSIAIYWVVPFGVSTRHGFTSKPSADHIHI